MRKSGIIQGHSTAGPGSGATLRAVMAWVLLTALAGFAQPPRPEGFRPAMAAAAPKLLAPAAQPWSDSRPFIQKMVDGVSSDSMLRTIGDLQAFGTRYEFTPQRDEAAEYLLGRLQGLGYAVESDWYAFGLNTFTDLKSAGSDSLWIIDSGGNIVGSFDHGSTWHLLHTEPAVSLLGIDLLDGREGWACGTTSVLLRTRDGGASWRRVTPAGSTTFYDVVFLPSGTLLACGSAGALYRNAGNGEIWNPVSISTSTLLLRLSAYDDAHVWCCGSSGELLFSADQGKSWQSRRQNTSAYLYALFFLSEQEGWVAGSDNYLTHTVDGGEHWTRIATNLPQNTTLRDIIMMDRLTGYVATNLGQIFSTRDGGVTWLEELSLLNLGWGPNLRRIGRFRDGSMVACGSQGVVLIREDEKPWVSSTERLPESLIHTSRNLVATRKGIRRPEQEVVMVAHYDSYSDDLYVHAPGANDNASGTSAVVEAARLCKSCEFDATLKFLLVSAEELGMYGSTHYVRQAVAEKREILAAVNGDMIGYPLTGDPSRLVAGSYLTHNRLLDSAMVYTARYGIGARLDTIVDATGASDYGPFAAAGFDALDIAEGTAEEIWGGLDPFYHKTKDTMDRLSPELLQKGGRIMLATAAEAAQVTGLSSVTRPPLANPADFVLEQNYPNPFNATTRIGFALPRAGHVTLKIYNARGEEVAELLARPLNSGRHSLSWDAAGLPSGPYFCRLSAEGWSRERMLLLVR